MSANHKGLVKLCVVEGKLTGHWVSSSENEAGIMTKPLASKTHKYLRYKIMNLE